MKNDNGNPARPQMPDEGDLLAFIEGEALPRDRELAVARAIEADPRLGQRLAAMRADRGVLRSLPQASAPAGLMEAVEAALQPVLERHMLLGLRDGEPLSGSPPVSVVQPVRRSVIATLFAERAGRRMAMAAGLLLLVGGASYFAAATLWPASKSRSVEIGPLAKADEKGQDLAAPKSRAADPETKRETSVPVEVASAKQPVVAPPAAEEQRTLAQTDSIPSGPARIEAKEVEQQDGILVGVEPEAKPAETAAAVAADTGSSIQNDRAIELAKENRLVIRLRAPDPIVLSEPERVADRIRRANSASWRLGDHAPAELAALLHAPEPAPRGAPASQRSDSPAYAGVDRTGMPGAEAFGPPSPEAAGYTPAPGPLVYIVETRLDGASLDSLRNALAPFGEAVLEEAPSALPLDNASLDPAAVVWWSQPPAGWTWWASVPVVIDRAE